MDFCRVTDDGIDHLFAPMEVGRRCVCGRTIAVLDHAEAWDVWPAPAFVLVGTAPHMEVRGFLRRRHARS